MGGRLRRRRWDVRLAPGPIVHKALAPQSDRASPGISACKAIAPSRGASARHYGGPFDSVRVSERAT